MKHLDLGTALAVIKVKDKWWTSAMNGKRTVIEEDPVEKNWEKYLWQPMIPQMSEVGANLVAVVESINAAEAAAFSNVVIFTESDKAVSSIEDGPSNTDKEFRLLVAHIHSFRNLMGRIWIGSPNNSVSLRNHWSSI